MQCNVICRTAKKYNLLCDEEKKLLLDVKEVVTLRDLCGMGSNAIYRFKSGLEALRPVLCGLILPSCIKNSLAQFERSGNLPVNTVLH